MRDQSGVYPNKPILDCSNRRSGVARLTGLVDAAQFGDTLDRGGGFDNVMTRADRKMPDWSGHRMRSEKHPTGCRAKQRRLEDADGFRHDSVSRFATLRAHLMPRTNVAGEIRFC